MKTALALILLGGVIVLTVVVAAAVTYDRDKERVAEFYQKNSNAATFPSDLQPMPVRPIEAFGLTAGCVMVLVGVYRSRTTSA